MEELQEEFFRRHDYYQVISLLLQKGETIRIPLYGFCMRPIIQNGDEATIIPTKPGNLRRGDIIVYRNEERFKIHRFLRFTTISDTLYLITKGDRTIHFDPPVSPQLLLGKVTHVHRGNKTINLETLHQRLLHLLLGRLSPFLSVIEYKGLPLPRRCASKSFRLVMGVGFREFLRKHKNFLFKSL